MTAKVPSDELLPEPKKPSKHRELADNTQLRIAMLVENSSPNPDRPKLSDARERRLADIERQTAACYARMEDITYKIGKLVDNIREHERLKDLVELPDDDEEKIRGRQP